MSDTIIAIAFGIAIWAGIIVFVVLAVRRQSREMDRLGDEAAKAAEAGDWKPALGIAASLLFLIIVTALNEETTEGAITVVVVFAVFASFVGSLLFVVRARQRGGDRVALALAVLAGLVGVGGLAVIVTMHGVVPIAIFGTVFLVAGALSAWFHKIRDRRRQGSDGSDGKE